MTSASANQNQRLLSCCFEEVMKARAASKPKIAYSVKCAALRVMKCAMANCSSLMFGNSHRKMGPTISEVLAAENAPVEAKKIKTIQSRSGR